MKKVIALLVLIAAFLVPLASAAVNETAEKQAIDSANLWLINQADGKWDILSSDDASLALLALSFDSRLALEGKDALLDKSMNSECWPSPACNVKSTALAVVALNKVGQNTDKPAAWLLSKKAAYTATGVTWILQIDSDDTTDCTVSYDGKSYSLALNADKTYAWKGAKPTCLSITTNNYRLEISKSCLDKSFDVACLKSAIVSLPYQSGNTLYVPSESFSAPATIAIRTVCMKEGASCSYDATLWTSLALQKTGQDYSALIPYLIDQKDENTKFMSDAFLYILTSRTEHAESVLSSQSKDGYWTDIGGFGKYYDTAIAESAIADYATENATKAKGWLIKEQKDGWGTTAKIRDTSLILSFVWPTAQKTVPTNDCETVYLWSCRTSCLDTEEQTTDSCISGICCKPKGAVVGCDSVKDCEKIECKNRYATDENGKLGKCEYPSEISCDDNFDNDGNGLTDMNDASCTQTCFQKGGDTCAGNEVCSENAVKASDTDECCLATCESKKTCAEQNGFECSANQQCDAWLTASDTLYCCSAKCKSKLNIIPFIIIALVLALGAGAFFLYKKGFFKKKFQIKKPIYPAPGQAMQQPAMQAYRPPVRPLVSQPQFQPQFQPAIKREVKSEMDETMKKLKKLAEEKK
jgi:hypothetical protein